MAIYLLGSPTESGNDLYLETQEVLNNASSGVAVYASIEKPSDHLLRYLGGDVPVAHSPHEGEITFVDELVEAEISALLPH